MSRKIEYVYVMTNESFDSDVVKIGKSDDIDRRANDLSNTSVPMRFRVEFAVAVHNAFQLEQKVHDFLHSYRISGNREFFCCGTFKAKQAIMELANHHGRVFEIFEGAKQLSYQELKKLYPPTEYLPRLDNESALRAEVRGYLDGYWDKECAASESEQYKKSWEVGSLEAKGEIEFPADYWNGRDGCGTKFEVFGNYVWVRESNHARILDKQLVENRSQNESEREHSAKVQDDKSTLSMSHINLGS